MASVAPCPKGTGPAYRVDFTEWTADEEMTAENSTKMTDKNYRSRRSAESFTGRRDVNDILDVLLKLFSKKKKRRRGWIKLNVGGVSFLSRKSVLEKFPQTLLGSLTEESEFYDEDEDEYIFDANPYIFQHILDFYRHGKLHIPNSLCGPIVKIELDFWQIDENTIEKCCWDHYDKFSERENTLRKLETAFTAIDKFEDDENERGRAVTCLRRCRQAVWYFFEDPKSSWIAQVYAVLSVFLILFCVLSVALDTIDKYRVPANISRLMDENETNPKRIMLDTTDSHPIMYYGDLAVAVIFGLELVVRFFVCPKKLKFLASVFTWLDIVVVVSQWYTIAMTFIPNYHLYPTLRKLHTVFHVLKVIRVFLFLKLARHYGGLQILLLALAASIKELCLIVIFMSAGMVLFATLIYFAEFEVHDAYEDIPRSFWWAIITMTTVGYGDTYPVTEGGYFVAAVCAFCGVLLMAMPVPIVANNFGVIYNVAKMKERMDRRNKSDANSFFPDGTRKSLHMLQEKINPTKIALAKVLIASGRDCNTKL